MATVTLDIAQFRVRFPAYTNVTTYPDATIQATWDVAILYINNVTNDCLNEDKLTYALELLTAHLLFLQTSINSGGSVGVISNATIDKVSVAISVPQSNGSLNYWLNQSPYGQQLLALLRTCAVGGFYIGGRNETGAFRRVGGTS